jgi:hypothetical protein
MSRQVVRLARLCGAIVALVVLLLLLGTSVSATGRQTPGSAERRSGPLPIPTFILKLINLSCPTVAGFAGNTAPTADADFPSVPFLPSSVGYRDEAQYDTAYRYTSVHVCTVSNEVDAAASNNVLASFKAKLRADHWLDSLNYPLAGKEDASCPDAQCVKKDDGHGVAYADIDDVKVLDKIQGGSLVLYTVRTARLGSPIPPPPLWFQELSQWTQPGIPLLTFIGGIIGGAIAQARGWFAWLWRRRPGGTTA